MAEPSASARTEPASPRRLAEARRQGQVPVSRSLSGAAGLAVVFAVLALGASAGVGRLVAYLRAALAGAATGTSPSDALALGLGQAAALLALPLGLAVFATLAAGLAQTGGLFTVAPLRLDAGRLRGRLFGGTALVDAGRGLFEAAVLLGLAALTMGGLLRPIAALAGAPAGRVLAAVGALSAALEGRLLAAALVLAAIDLVWQRHRHRQALRMTRAEVERERRQHEGDPRVRAERQRQHRALLAQPLPEAIRQSSFVVVGERQAVALRHEEGAAPIVVARGQRLLAARIEALAREAGVLLFPDAALAAELHAVEEGQEIPQALYAPVARIVKVILEGSSR